MSDDKDERKGYHHHFALFLVVCALGALGFAGNARFSQMTFSDQRDFPGGPNEVVVQLYSNWANVMAFVSYIMMGWMADGFLLWRFLTFWNKKPLLSMFPALLFLGSLATSIVFIANVARPGGSLMVPNTIRFATAYWSLSLVFNILITFSIAGRILTVRERVTTALGTQAPPFLSAQALLIECAALYTLWTLVFFICYVRKTPFINLLLPPLGQVQGITTMLILFRRSQGRGWSEHTVNGTRPPSDRLSTIALGEMTTATPDAHAVLVQALEGGKPDGSLEAVKSAEG